MYIYIILYSQTNNLMLRICSKLCKLGLYFVSWLPLFINLLPSEMFAPNLQNIGVEKAQYPPNWRYGVPLCMPAFV
uniref:Uncharacterized protein n=1 Tax=Ciona intestinalis TaxID=7719 RepID=H2XMK6_CIOIN